MAAGTTTISVDEYLRTNSKPGCEYIDGVLRQKPMGTRKHGRLEMLLGRLIDLNFPEYQASGEVTVRIREGKYFIPDVIVERRDQIQDPYPIQPVHVCIEVRSPDDRMSEIFAKCEEYHEWGVETTWVVDPETRRAWEYRKGQLPSEVPATGSLTADGISIQLNDLFSAL